MLCAVITGWSVSCFAAADSRSCDIVFLGDSTVITSYLPEPARPQAVLKETLAGCYPGQDIRVFNLAQNGDFIGNLITSGRYVKEVLARFEKINIVIVRYGQNDWKNMSPELFGKWLERLCCMLEADYPGITIILEAGMFFDPAHHPYPANESHDRYFDRTRQTAVRQGYAVSDVYQAMKQATGLGRWDLRVRSDGTTVDSRLDHQHKDDLKWFSNGHPNPAGVLVAVDTEAAVIRQLFPDKLPVDTGRRKGRGDVSLFTGGIRPPTETVLEQPDETRAESGVVAVTVPYAGPVRATIRADCLVRSAGGDPVTGKIRARGEQTVERPFVITPRGNNISGAEVCFNLYLPAPRSIEVEFRGAAALKGLRIERFIWNKE